MNISVQKMQLLKKEKSGGSAVRAVVVKWPVGCKEQRAGNRMQRCAVTVRHCMHVGLCVPAAYVSMFRAVYFTTLWV